ncbi:hypothetical protein [Streptomyces pacificus]|uniref:Uncharacterized protein n=1 Tax=Streptomyces pacificus TaxID=2705029 RepID=A0A6A0APW9_9ACTN|nr:hypothetical protein [Streptomyces pacificus]GFH34343.1 hypothetical protein SCWH03_05570 [Streptomyces pacificus]
MNIRFRRWTLEVYRRALHITRGPHPDCPTCAGHGGIEVHANGWPEHDLCHCWDPAPVVRIPLWFRRTEGVPF